VIRAQLRGIIVHKAPGISQMYGWAGRDKGDVGVVCIKMGGGGGRLDVGVSRG